MNMQELLTLSIDDDSPAASPWRVGINYKQLKFDGYMHGTRELSNDDVLIDGVEARTDLNFPVLPTVIHQETLISSISYKLNVESSLTVSIPLIKQSTEACRQLDEWKKMI